jgi:hypothetical protein
MNQIEKAARAISLLLRCIWLGKRRTSEQSIPLRQLFASGKWTGVDIRTGADGFGHLEEQRQPGSKKKQKGARPTA